MSNVISYSQFQTTGLSSLWCKLLARVTDIDPGLYLFDPTRIHFPTNMIRITFLGKLRMHKRNTNGVIPLDVVPKRRTKRRSPRFRPGDRFSELSFRYLSVIYSQTIAISIYTTQHSSYDLHVVNSSLGAVSWCGEYPQLCMRSWRTCHFLGSKPLFKSCRAPNWCLTQETDNIDACAEQTKGTGKQSA